jgi:hypothetical protein
MKNDELSDFWRLCTDDQRISMLKRLHMGDVSVTAEELGINYPEGIQHLDRLAEQAGLVKVYVTVVDVAGMRDYEPGVASPAFAQRHRARK